MRDSEELDDNTLAAFVDGQLDAAGCEAVSRAIAHDRRVAARVDAMRRTKQLVRLGFAGALPPLRQRSPASSSRLRRRALAASVALVSLCLAAGSVGYHYGRHLDHSALADSAQVQGLHPERVVLHVSDGNPAQFEAALEYAVDFLEQHPESDSRVELIANAGGLNMMRAGVSPFEEEIGNLLAANPKLNLLACANAIANLRKRGIEPEIIADIETGETAIDHIVARLQGGWRYVRADALPNI